MIRVRCPRQVPRTNYQFIVHLNNLQRFTSYLRTNMQPRSAHKVGELMAEHVKALQPKDQLPCPDQGMQFQDFDVDADGSDSGLESII